MQKIMQKVTSVALAASMLFSMMSTTALAFADETGDSTSVSTDVTDAPAAEEADAVDSGSSNDADSSDATSAPTITDVVDLTHESYEDANSDDETTQDATSDVVDGEETSESDANDTEVSTPETAEPTFVGLQTVTPEYGDKLTADVGDSITLDALLNRDDVSVTYQWQRKQNFAVNTALALYNYEEDEPTWYNFVIEDTTEHTVLEERPDYVWQGCEMYFAIVDALDDIGADSSDVQVAWHTPNFVLDGYSISAGMAEDGTTEIYASNEENTYTARVNDEGEWEFSDESTANLKNDWQDIEGATESTYTFEVTEDDLFATYRCRITVTDEAYREENFKALEDLGNELTEEDKTGDIILQTVQFSISLPEDENSSDIAVRRMPATVAMLADTFSARATGGVAISSDNQWITGLDSNYEYITKNMYDQVTEWFNAGKIDKATADRYWTQIGGAWSTANVYTANVLDDNKFPTGATREYYGFPLTDGDKLEVNSEWYGQTVYFRPHNDSNDWNLTGTAVSVPAYTAVLRNNGSYGTGASGTKYKDAVVFLNPWISDAGRVYANYINYITDNGWLCNNDGSHMSQHITVLSVNVETFNKNPDKFMMDAEGNYRIDSIGWGVCVGQEPDLSGKAYYAIKAFLSQGYGMCIGHDTMYAYAGSWYDAHEAGYTDPGSRDYYEGGRYGPDKNDTSTRYYVLNSVPNIDNGHWNMNALMGANGGNIDSGTVLPTDAISMILSTGGSHSSYGKAGIMYGSDQLSVKLKPYSNSQAQSTVKYRNPTNFPYDLPSTLSAAKTHSNSQVAFGPIWVDYAGGNVTGAEFGYNPDPTTKTITDEETGRSWFGTSNFYLSGTGNFLMNQIGHLPDNQATRDESALFANTVMYISQRKQCEICAAQQNGQEDVHFVIRVSSVNAQQVLSALQAGGTFWYPLNGCYQLTDDLTLPEGWKPIKNFSGHWNADVYKVKLASNNQPVFDNTSVTANGMYTSGKNNGWNLGSDMTKGTLPILKLDNQPDVRITGVARVVGDLNALFPTSYGATDYTGYKVVVHGSDGVDYNCVVNSDSKYVISNLPTTGMMRADVIDKSGNKVTQFGMITVDVPSHFWNDTETHPLQLMTPTADPIEDYKDWEGPVNKTVDSKLYYNEQLKASDVTWYYRIISVDNQVGDWVKIGNPGTSFDTSDGTVSGKINSLTFTAATDSDLPYTTSSVSYSKLDYTTNRIQFKCEYNVSGTVYSSMDKAEDGRNGYVDVEIRPMYIEQAFDRRISVGGSTSFSFDAFYWKGVEDGLTYEVQYRDASGNWVAVGSDSTLFPSSKYKISYVTKTDDNDALGGGVWYPSDFWVPDSFTGSDAKMNAGKSTFNKHTTVTLELSNAAMDWDGTDFRCVFAYKSIGHTMSTDTTMANDIAQARTGHLIIYAPPIEMTPLKAQSLLLNNYDSHNGNLAWTTPASNPNNGRSPKEIPLDAIAPDKLGQNGKAYGAANDNKAIYTTKITYYGNKDSAPTIKWLYSDVAGGGSLSQFKDVGDAVTLKYSDVGKKIGNISKLNSRVAELEKSFMSSGKAFNKFSGYIKLEAMYPTESKNLNNSSYAEWNAIVSLYIDNATNPMDYGDTHFYFRCQAEAQYMQNWDSANMKPYTTAATDAYNFNRDVNSSNPEDHLYKDISQSSYGAELVLDYNISIKANVPNKATKKRNTITTANGSAKDISTLRNEISEINTALNNGGAVYNYKDLAIIAPNGLRYMETYFIAGNGVNNRSGIDSRDTVVIDNKIRNSDGKCFTDLFEKVTDDEFVNKRQGFAYRSKSGSTIPKETWEWFWRNAIYYICYDAPTTKANMDQVYFYIDEHNLLNVNSSFSANSEQNPYSEWTAPVDGTYEITLNGAGGFADGGRTVLTVNAQEGAKLYFVTGGAGSDANQDDNYLESGHRTHGGYNGGGDGGLGMRVNHNGGPYVSIGSSGGGATTVAVGLMGNGRLTDYIDEQTASRYFLGVAGGGGGRTHSAAENRPAFVFEYWVVPAGTPGAIRIDSTNYFRGQTPNADGAATILPSGTPYWAGEWNGNTISAVGGPSANVKYFGYDGEGAFGQGANGGDFSSISGTWSHINGPAGGGGGWYGGWANPKYYLAENGINQSCDSPSGGGLSYVASNNQTFTTSTGKTVTVLNATMYDGTGSAVYQPGSATIRMVKSSVSRFSRNGKNAFDTAYEDTDPDSGIEEQHVTITITAANKLYDGNPDEASISVSGNLSSTDMDNIVKNTTIVYANRKGTLTKAPSDASTDKNQYPRSDCGSYTATAKCTASGYIITYRYENTNPGHTYDGSSPSGIGDTVKFDIYPRGLTIIGTGDKPYDRTSKATLENVHIASGGLIAKDENTVKLSTTTVTGNYTVDGKNVSDAGGPYVVIRTSELSLVGNSARNYYIEKEDLSGSITPLDLYVHSIYLEDPTYPRNVKHYDGTTKATIKDILIDGVLEGDDVKIKEETLPGNYKTKDAGQNLNADGTVSSNWPYELDENPITADAHPTLTGKDAKNYRITKEKYSGAIARANLTAQVASWRGLYGDGVGEKPWHDKKAYGYGTAASAGCWLEIDGLVQGDTLTLDQSYKKSYFKTLVSGHENLVPDESTPVGTYPLTYVGLTEANYPVLKNYIVMVLNGRFVVDPRPLHVTVLDSDKIIYNENPNFHVNIQMEDDDANLIDVVSDVDATPILDAKLKAKDTVSSVLYVAGGNPSNLTQEFVDAYDYRKQENVKESKTNIPFVTDCTIRSLPLYADGTSTDDDFEWNYDDKTCDFCHYNHKLLAPYLVTINTDTKSGPALDVHTVVNPNGETVRNYELIIHDGGLYVHPALLKATVPLYVCMYGNTTSGEVKEPTNYRITNYSTVAIQIKNIKANGPWLMRDMPGMEYYPDGEYGNSVYDMTKNRLRRGELYMRLRDTVLTQGDNAIDHSDTAWVIPKATGDFINNNITGRAMQVPMAVYIATGNVNESGVCTPVTKVTYTIAPYGGVMPNDADFEKVQSQPWLKDAK